MSSTRKSLAAISSGVKSSARISSQVLSTTASAPRSFKSAKFAFACAIASQYSFFFPRLDEFSDEFNAQMQVSKLNVLIKKFSLLKQILLYATMKIMNTENKNSAAHWADVMAQKIIREKGDLDLYTCASGITPSGTVHLGNFREIITVDLVARALADQGKKVRFIYSWDDYDVFRKVPANMPNPETLEKYLRYPITLVPDTTGRDENYARHHEVDIETQLPRIGIHPEFLYQAQRYRANRYAEGIKIALQNRETIKECLNEYRDEIGRAHVLNSSHAT